MRGAFILSRKILAYVPAEEYFEIGKHLIPEVVTAGGLFFGYASNDYSKGIDTLEKWKEVEDYMRSNGFSADCESIELR
jgi:NDP-sugar pyrophosphorylase family protein